MGRSRHRAQAAIRPFYELCPYGVLRRTGYVAIFAYGLLEILGQNAGLVLFAPGAVFEIVFPLGLIVKGFDPSAAILSEPGTTDPNGDEKESGKLSLSK
jgi:hypothetical protein